MKKFYTTHKFKLRQEHISKRSYRKFKNRIRRFLEKRKLWVSEKPSQNNSNLEIFAPRDFRLTENTELCLAFFRDLRKEENITPSRRGGFIRMSLRDVEKIDYGTISIVNAISDDLKASHINLKGNFPRNKECFDFMLESGYLNHMYINNQRVQKSDSADLIFFEKGSGKLSERDSAKIGEMTKNVMNHLTGERVHSQKLRTVILEICGNSIEHASTPDRQWLLGVKYQENKILFTVSDVGKGILETLHRKYRLILADLFSSRSDHTILERAFKQKYGSSTQETNRNKGLPAIKAAHDNGTILNLIAITNNVVLNFSNENLSRTLSKGSARLKGTFYQWEITKECIL